MIELTQQELTNFQLGLNNVNGEKNNNFINRTNLGTLNLRVQKLDASVGESTLGNYNLNPLVLKKDFSYTNEERNLRGDAWI